MGDQNLNLPVTLSLSSTQNGSETTNNPVEVVGVDAGSDTGEKSEPKVLSSDSVRVKRARGRPRKCEVDGNKSSLMSASVSVSETSESTIQPFGSEVKRGRGRPRGSGKLQILASMGMSFFLFSLVLLLLVWVLHEFLFLLRIEKTRFNVCDS